MVQFCLWQRKDDTDVQSPVEGPVPEGVLCQPHDMNMYNMDIGKSSR